MLRLSIGLLTVMALGFLGSAPALAQDEVKPGTQPGAQPGTPPGPGETPGTTPAAPVPGTPVQPEIVRPDQPKPEETRPPHEIEWEALSKEFNDLAVATKFDFTKNVELSRKLAAFIGNFGAAAPELAPKAMDYVFRIVRRFDSADSALQGAALLSKMATMTLSKDDAANDALRTQIYYAQARTLMNAALFSQGADKLKHYKNALALVATTLERKHATDEAFANIHGAFMHLMLLTRQFDKLQTQLQKNIDAQSDPNRKLILQVYKVETLAKLGKWEDVLSFSKSLQEVLEAPRNRAARINVLKHRAMAFVVREEDTLRDETFDVLRKLGPEGVRAVDEVKMFTRFMPGKEARSFYLYDISEDRKPHELEDFAGRFVLLVFFRAMQKDNASTVLMDAIAKRSARFSQDVLSVIAIGAGNIAGETIDDHRKFLANSNWPRERALYDTNNVVGNSFGIDWHNFPAAVLLDKEGKIICGAEIDATLSRLGAIDFAIEQMVELTEEGTAAAQPDQGELENTPEFKKLLKLIDECGLSKDHPVRLVKTLARAYVALGADRATIRSRLMTLIRGTSDQAERQVLRNLYDKLKEK